MSKANYQHIIKPWVPKSLLISRYYVDTSVNVKQTDDVIKKNHQVGMLLLYITKERSTNIVGKEMHRNKSEELINTKNCMHINVYGAVRKSCPSFLAPLTLK